MRVLVSTAPMVGHFFPMVPLCWALRAAGHHVLVSAPANFAPTITSCGLTASGDLPAVEMAELMSRDRSGRPVPAVHEMRARLRRSGTGWARLGAVCLAPTLTLIRRFRPDVVLGEPVDFAGRLAAHQAGVPLAEHGWGLRPPPLFADAAAEELRDELAAMGAAGLPAPALRIDPCPPQFQHPGGDPAAGARYVPFNGARPRPEWLDEPRRRPRVFVTFGTLLPQINPGQTMPLLRYVIERLPELGVDVYVGAAPATAAELPVPDRGAVGWLPLDQVLPGCDAIIHYGGSGAMMTALTFGVPQIVLAAAVADAPDNAARVADTGVGIGLSPDEAMRCEPVGRACERLLADPAYAARAAAMAAANAAQPPPARTVERLESLA